MNHLPAYLERATFEEVKRLCLNIGASEADAIREAKRIMQFRQDMEKYLAQKQSD